jgi:hypothetical protein
LLRALFYFLYFLSVDIESDLMNTGVKIWRTKALGRREWASIVREAKAKLKGL